MMVESLRFIKHSIFCFIIFSNTCFGKEFDELFTIYEPIDSSSKIEKSINNSFNTMIYRLSGNPSPSNVWKIINAGNSRKDFITSYSIKNLDDKNFLQVHFDKDLLVEKFNELSIPALGNSRPVILFLINIDSGTERPYLLTESESKLDLDMLIKNALIDMSASRGIFLELPELGLEDMNSVSKYPNLIDSNNLVKSQHVSNKVIEINIAKVGFNNWSVTGDINFEYQDNNFNKQFLINFNDYIAKEINKLFESNLIDTSKETSIILTLSNINNYDDYIISRDIIERMISTKNINIASFESNKISYEMSIYGDFKTFVNEVSESNFARIINISYENNSLNLDFFR
tara:strand:- start:7665 stop:8699 length:1035 start_codon:yes stop_codon:yes gene_type:complete